MLKFKMVSAKDKNIESEVNTYLGDLNREGVKDVDIQILPMLQVNPTDIFIVPIIHRV